MNFYKVLSILTLSSSVFAITSSNPMEMIQDYQKKTDNHWLSNYVTMATIDDNGYPKQRMMRIYQISNDGLVFYTDARSDKVKEFNKNNLVSMLFIFPQDNKNLIQVALKGQIEFMGIVKSKFYRPQHDKNYGKYIFHPISIKFTDSDSLNQKNQYVTHQHQLYEFKKGHWAQRAWSETITKYEKTS